MAKRKINGIKFNMFDERMLDFLGKFHCSDLDHIKKYCKHGNRSISQKRIDMFLEKGYIQKDRIRIRGKVITVYFLDKKGELYIKGTYRNTTCKAYKSTSKKHDFKHMEAIMRDYEIEDIRNYYKSEFELEKGRNHKNESRTDGAFIFGDDRQDIYVETITQHYKDDMKLAKRLYAANRNGAYKTISVTI